MQVTVNGAYNMWEVSYLYESGTYVATNLGQNEAAFIDSSVSIITWY